MSTPPINQSLRARAYENFRQQILQANVQPGQFVSQRELMQLLDMPLGAVRELIPRLEAEGLLRTVPQRGLQIAHVDLKLIHNAFQLRAMLEREAALHFVQVVSDADLANIEQAHLSIVQRAARVCHERPEVSGSSMRLTVHSHWQSQGGTLKLL